MIFKTGIIEKGWNIIVLGARSYMSGPIKTKIIYILRWSLSVISDRGDSKNKTR